MVEPAELGLAAVAAFGASEATGITDVTGLGGGGGGDSSGGDGGPPVDLSGLRASVAELGGRVAANSAASGVDRPGVDLSGLLARSLTDNNSGSQPITTIIGDTARSGVGGVVQGAADGFTETTGIDRLNPGGVGGGGDGSEPFAGFEETGRTAGENIGQGLGGGAGNVIGYGVESAGNAILRPYRNQVQEIKRKTSRLPNAVRDGGKWFPNDPLTNVARNRTPGENIDIGGLLTADSPTDSGGSSGGSSGGFLSDLTSDGRLNEPLIGESSGSSNSSGSGESNIDSRDPSGSDAYTAVATAGGDPAGTDSDSARNASMERDRNELLDEIQRVN